MWRYSHASSYWSSLLYIYANAAICRSVASVTESEHLSSRDDAPAAAAKACGERYRRDVDHSPEAPPSSADDGPVKVSEQSAATQPSSREEEEAREQQRAALKSDCDRNMGSTAIGACGASGSSFKNVVMVTESFKTAMN